MSAATFAGFTACSCPFCGNGDNILYATQARGTDFWFVECLNIDCHAQGPQDLGRSGAVVKWNNAARTVRDLSTTFNS